MNALLICPAERPGLEHLIKAAPLAAVPIFGQTLVEHWLDEMSRKGATHVRVLAVDRPHLIRSLLDDGSRWGFKLEVLPERTEPTREEALAQFTSSSKNPVVSVDQVFLMDHLPGFPKFRLFDDYAAFFAALTARLNAVKSADRIGVREIEPGIWVGLRTRIDRSARVHAPCWIGEHVWIGPDAEIGPMTVLEDRVFVDHGAWIEQSYVACDSYVGEFVELRHSLAWGARLINWQNGSFLSVPDDFLLSGFKRPKPLRAGSNWFGRLAALVLLQLTVPVGLYGMLKSSILGLPAFRAREAVLPWSHELPEQEQRTITYFEMNSTNKFMRRWPQLWNVACGEFAWVGNRPLSPKYAAQLTSDFEKLWLNAPVGVVSLADVEGAFDKFDEQARAHAAFYATRADWRLDLQIMARFVTRMWQRAKEELTAPIPEPVPESKRITIRS
ncbi:MAG TPA: sugar transferase [Verrucomicrobiae bacterium]|nr:sugar transferase [Verrucomicrobiae bacterium]